MAARASAARALMGLMITATRCLSRPGIMASPATALRMCRAFNRRTPHQLEMAKARATAVSR